jgi:hypothetical protein
MKVKTLPLFILIVTSVVLVPWSCAWAEIESLPIPPRTPLLGLLPDSAAWTVRFKGADGRSDDAAKPGDPLSPKARALRAIEIKKSGNLRVEESIWSDGTSTEKWYSGNFMLITMPGQSDVYIFRKDTNGDAALKGQFPNFAQTDFPEVGWVSLETFRRVAVFQGRPCYLFDREIELWDGPTKQSKKQQVWIDGESQLPLAFDNGGVLQTYLFDKAASTALSLPPKFQEELARYREKLAGTNKHKLKR